MTNQDNINDMENDEILDFSPYRLLKDFTKTRIGPCIVIAVVLHVAVIGGISVAGLIIGHYTGDDEAAMQDQAAADGRPPASQPATGPAKGDDKTAKKKSPIEKKITEKAKPGELPKGPSDIGISIDETNQ
jgi:hypothetical protein